jgi:outer membrane protein TolC
MNLSPIFCSLNTSFGDETIKKTCKSECRKNCQDNALPFLLSILCLLSSVLGPLNQAGAQNVSDPGNQSSKSYTLSESVQRCLQVNPQIEEAKYEVKKAQDDIGSARSSFLPTLGANYQYNDLHSIDSSGPTETDYLDQDSAYWNLQLTQQLFAGLTVLNSYQKSKLQEDMRAYQKDKVEMELIREVQSSFLQLLQARADVQSLQDTIERLQAGLKSVQAYYEQDMAPYVQVLEAEVELANARQDLSKAQNQVETHRVRLNILLGHDPVQDIDYQGELQDMSYIFSPSLSACLDCAFEQRPDIRIIDKSIGMAEKEEDIALGQFSPRVNLQGNYYSRDTDYDAKGQNIAGQSFDRDQENEYWTVGITVEWPLFEGGRRYYGYQKASHEISRLQQRLKYTKDQIRSEVRTSFLSLTEARSRIETNRTALKAAQENFERSLKRLQSGMGTSTEVLDAQARLTRAEANLTQSRADYQLSLADLMYAIGQRNVDLSPVVLE